MRGQEDGMANGYWIIRTDVRDFHGGYQAYMQSNLVTFSRFPSRLIVRGGAAEIVEGAGRSRNIVRQFPSYENARECYHSPEYERARPLRQPYAVVDFTIAEGYAGAQPPPTPSAPASGERKGYWIGHFDPASGDRRDFTDAEFETIGQFGGRFLVRRGAREVTEGSVRAATVLLEFPGYETALACYRSREYQAASTARRRDGNWDLCIAEQYDGPQLP
jgi:uncharacterized protein (DUF1330 family)